MQVVVDNNGVQSVHGPAGAPQVTVSSQNGTFGALGTPSPQDVRAGLDAWLGGKSSTEVNQTIADLQGRSEQRPARRGAADAGDQARGLTGGPQVFMNDLLDQQAKLENRIDDSKSKSTWKPEALQTKQDKANQAQIQQDIARDTDLLNNVNKQIDSIRDAGPRVGLTHAVDNYVAGPKVDRLADVKAAPLAQIEAHLTQEIAAAENAGFDPKELKALLERVQNEPDARAAMAQIGRHGVDGLTNQVNTAKGLLDDFRATKEDYTGCNAS